MLRCDVRFYLIVGLTVCGLIPVVEAQETESAVALQEVVVTAQKRETNLQETPISIAVLTSATLENLQAVSLASLSDGAVPSLRLAPFFGRSSALNVAFRGVGASFDANQPARDAGDVA